MARAAAEMGAVADAAPVEEVATALVMVVEVV